MTAWTRSRTPNLAGTRLTWVLTVPSVRWRRLPISASGNAFSSAPDLVRFRRALSGYELLDPVHTELTLSPKVPRVPVPAGPGVSSGAVAGMGLGAISIR